MCEQRLIVVGALMCFTFCYYSLALNGHLIWCLLFSFNEICDCCEYMEYC